MNMTMILLFAMCLVSVAVILTGLHDIDNSWNLAYVEKNFNLNLTDSNAFGRAYEPSGLYNLGMMLTMVGSVMLGVSAFNLGLVIRK